MGVLGLFPCTIFKIKTSGSKDATVQFQDDVSNFIDNDFQEIMQEQMGIGVMEDILGLDNPTH